MENCSMSSHYSQNNRKQLTKNYKNWRDLAPFHFDFISYYLHFYLLYFMYTF